MKKSSHLLGLATSWILVSLVWFFISKNSQMGILWLCTGLIGLVTALVIKTKENQKK